MRETLRSHLLVALILLCTQAVMSSKYCAAQVGLGWNPAQHQTNLVIPAYIPQANRNALAFDVSDPNEIQRSVLFDYFNVHRDQVYSSDGVTGWNTNRSRHPIQSLHRDRNHRFAVDSQLGSGYLSVDPFPKRIYQPYASAPPADTSIPTQAPPPATVVPRQELPPAPTRAQTNPFVHDAAQPETQSHSGSAAVIPELKAKDDPVDSRPATEMQDNSNDQDSMPEDNLWSEDFDDETLGTELFPPPEDYDNATGEIDGLDNLPEVDLPEVDLPAVDLPAVDLPGVEGLDPPGVFDDLDSIEWDDSLLEELPDLNSGARRGKPLLPGNPLPPTSADLNRFGMIDRSKRSNRPSRQSNPPQTIQQTTAELGPQHGSPGFATPHYGQAQFAAPPYATPQYHRPAGQSTSTFQPQSRPVAAPPSWNQPQQERPRATRTPNVWRNGY